MIKQFYFFKRQAVLFDPLVGTFLVLQFRAWMELGAMAMREVLRIL